MSCREDFILNGASNEIAWSGLRTPEFALVVAATAWPLDSERCEHISNLAANVSNWTLVLDIILRHRVTGLALHGFSQAGITLPALEHAQLAESARENAIEELRNAFETLQLCRQFSSAGIAVLVLKGITVAHLIYGRYGVRSSTDIDLLIHKEDLQRAEELLRRAGYVRTEPAPDATPAEIAVRNSRYKDYSYEHVSSGCVLELHWRLFTNAHLYRPDPWATATTMALPGEPALPVLGREDFILYLCMHGAEHGWMRLKWLADLAALISNKIISSENLYQKSCARGVTRLIGPGLLLCHQLYGTELPEKLQQDFKNDRWMRLLHQACLDSLIGEEDGTELDDRTLATARKNFSHYLFSFRPSFLLHEMRFDLLDKKNGEKGAKKSFRRLGRITKILLNSLRRRA